jgi:hypothetical protein
MNMNKNLTGITKVFLFVNYPSRLELWGQGDLLLSPVRVGWVFFLQNRTMDGLSMEFGQGGLSHPSTALPIRPYLK